MSSIKKETLYIKERVNNCLKQDYNNTDKTLGCVLHALEGDKMKFKGHPDSILYDHSKTHLAIHGEGAFLVRDKYHPEKILLTREGMFSHDMYDYLVNVMGLQLLGYK